jgi:hypothetical protein
MDWKLSLIEFISENGFHEWSPIAIAETRMLVILGPDSYAVYRT